MSQGLLVVAKSKEKGAKVLLATTRHSLSPATMKGEFMDLRKDIKVESIMCKRLGRRLVAAMRPRAGDSFCPVIISVNSVNLHCRSMHIYLNFPEGCNVFSPQRFFSAQNKGQRCLPR